MDWSYLLGKKRPRILLQQIYQTIASKNVDIDDRHHIYCDSHYTADIASDQPQWNLICLPLTCGLVVGVTPTKSYTTLTLDFHSNLDKHYLFVSPQHETFPNWSPIPQRHDNQREETVAEDNHVW